MQDRTTHDPTSQNPTTQNPTAQNPTIHRPEVRESKQEERAPEEIRRDIRQTRGEMDRTVDELVDRFSVGNLIDEAWQRMRKNGGGDLGVGEMLREHPVPIALVGLGLGWLAVEQASGHSMSTDEFGSESRTGGGRSGAPSPESHRPWNGEGTTLAGDSGQTMENGRSDGDGMIDRVSDQASEAMSTAGEKVSDMKESTKDAGARTQARFQELLSESPLTIGSIVFGLGLASGLAVPSSELEDREIGGVSDRIKSEAGRIGSDAAERAGEIGREVADTAMHEVRDQVDDLQDDGADEPRPAGT